MGRVADADGGAAERGGGVALLAMSARLLLAVAIAFEVAATACLKLSDGFAKWQWAAASIALYWVCFGAWRWR